jgi:hypothetical protein
MQAIEIDAEIDYNGLLKIKKPLSFKNRNVRLIVLISDEDDNLGDDRVWLKSLSSNPVFTFLHDEAEDIYTLADGEPFPKRTSYHISANC